MFGALRVNDDSSLFLVAFGLDMRIWYQSEILDGLVNKAQELRLRGLSSNPGQVTVSCS